MRIVTGYEQTVAHNVDDNFAYPAKRNGTVIEVDNESKIVVVKYEAEPMVFKQKIKINQSDKAIEEAYSSKQPIFVVRRGKDVATIKLGDLVQVNDKFPAIVNDKLSFTTIDQLSSTVKLTEEEKKEFADAKDLYLLALSVTTPDANADIDIIQFGNRYTNVSGTQVQQSIVLSVKEGQSFKREDILAYNEDFFEPVFNSTQVAWKHGVMANIVFIEDPDTFEDSTAITEELAQKLATTSGHTRDIVVESTTSVTNLVSLGTAVETTDYLCTIEEGDIGLLLGEADDITADVLASLNRKNPKAKYHGIIAQIEMYYCCEPSKLHPSLQAIARGIAKKYAKRAKLSAEVNNPDISQGLYRVPVNSTFRGTKFEDGTVLIKVTIAEESGCVPGDKLVVMAANKSIINQIMDRPIKTLSGRTVDMKFAGKSVQNRIVPSVFLNGAGEVAVEACEKKLLEDYFA